MEIIEIYNKVKRILNIYAAVPKIAIDWVKDLIFSGKDKAE
jgi:hypothetical protein